jgi:hypothetical protein
MRSSVGCTWLADTDLLIQRFLRCNAGGSLYKGFARIPCPTAFIIMKVRSSLALGLFEFSNWVEKVPPRILRNTADWVEKVPPAKIRQTGEWVQTLPSKEELINSFKDRFNEAMGDNPEAFVIPKKNAEVVN